MIKLIRKLLLVKEIISKEGICHFRRYRLISTPWFNLYVHQILKSDEEKDLHNHPFSFWSFIVKGSYKEKVLAPPFYRERFLSYKTYDLVHHKYFDFHQLTLLSPVVWTVVLTYGEKVNWGYQTDNGYIDHKRYRLIKNSNFKTE